jgi:hypothetical protein
MDLGCAVCGDPIQHNSVARGKFRNKETGEVTRTRPLKNPGWAHSDSNRRDHPATPAVGRTPEADQVRQNAAYDQAGAAVKSSLQSGFDHLHAERAVNEIFRDRR